MYDQGKGTGEVVRVPRVFRGREGLQLPFDALLVLLACLERAGSGARAGSGQRAGSGGAPASESGSQGGWLAGGIVGWREWRTSPGGTARRPARRSPARPPRGDGRERQGHPPAQQRWRRPECTVPSACMSSTWGWGGRGGCGVGASSMSPWHQAWWSSCTAFWRAGSGVCGGAGAFFVPRFPPR